MEVVLADALLARGGDPSAVLRAVCAPLSAERAEALRLLLQRLAAAAEGEGEGQAAAGEALRRAAWEVALERCRPLLRLGEGAAGGAACAERLRLCRALRGALRHCVQLCGAPLAARLARDALAELEGGGGGGGAGAEAAVEALAAAAPWLEEPALVARSVAAALALLRDDGEAEAAAALAAGRLLPALGGNGEALGRVWEGLLGAGGEPPGAGRALLALSALCDALLPRGAAAGPDARLCPRFWRLVQQGLARGDGLCRRRARYLLKRAVDLCGGQAACLRCPPDGGDGKDGGEAPRRLPAPAVCVAPSPEGSCGTASARCQRAVCVACRAQPLLVVCRGERGAAALLGDLHLGAGNPGGKPGEGAGKPGGSSCAIASGPYSISIYSLGH